MLKGKVNLKKLIPHIWQISLGVVSLIVVVLLMGFWLSGKQETRDAVDSGRRLLLTLSDNSIEGKLISSKPPGEGEAPSPAPIAADKPAEPVTAEKPAEATPVPAPAPAEMPAEPVAEPQPEATETQTPAEAPAAPAPVVPEMEDTVVSLPAARQLPGMNPALTEKTEWGTLPIIGSDGTKPWRYYAKPFQRSGNDPMIVIIVTGLGPNKAVSDAALKLPENVTLSFSPYTSDINSWGAAARATGHETLIDLPLEPSNYPASDPGPHGLITNKGALENEKNLQWVMSRLPAYVGFLTPQNEGFSASNESFKLLLQSLANRGLLLVVGREPAKNETKDIIDSTSTASVTADVLLDEDLSVTAIQTRLSAVEELAKRRGYAVAIAQPYPVTMEQLRLWSATLKNKGFILVPVTAIARLRFS